VSQNSFTIQRKEASMAKLHQKGTLIESFRESQKRFARSQHHSSDYNDSPDTKYFIMKPQEKPEKIA